MRDYSNPAHHLSGSDHRGDGAKPHIPHLDQSAIPLGLGTEFLAHDGTVGRRETGDGTRWVPEEIVTFAALHNIIVAVHNVVGSCFRHRPTNLVVKGTDHVGSYTGDSGKNRTATR